MKIRPYSGRVLEHSLYRSLILCSMAVALFAALLFYFLVKEDRAVNNAVDNRMNSLLSTAVHKHAIEATQQHLQMHSRGEEFLKFAAYLSAKSPQDLSLWSQTLLLDQLKADTTLVANIAHWLITQEAASKIVSLTLTLEGKDIHIERTIKQNTVRDGLGVVVYDFAVEYPFLDTGGRTYKLNMLGVSQLEEEQLHLFYLLAIILLVFIVVILSITHLFYRLRQAYRIQTINEQYFWGLVHDLKTPLSYAKILLDKLHTDLSTDSNNTSHLQIIEGSLQIDRLTEKVDNLLSLPKLSQLSTADYIKCYPSDLLFEIEEELRLIYSHLDFQFRFIVDEQISLNLPYKHLQIILRILMDNAVCYASQYGMLEVELRLLNRELHFMIRDEGKGLAIKGKKVVIKPTTLIPAKGNGIGLITVSRVLEALNSSLVYEKLAKGCQFSFKVPIKS